MTVYVREREPGDIRPQWREAPEKGVAVKTIHP